MSEWNGEGIPPVGTVCEATWGTRLDGWHKAVILETKDKLAWFAFKWAKGWDVVDDEDVINAEFRPLQSEEQKQVAELEAMLTTSIAPTNKALAQEIYNAGFRKVEQ